MIDMFDKLQQQLADAIDPTTNTVGHFIKQIYTENTPEAVAKRVQGFASGGIAGNNNEMDLISSLNGLQRVENDANKTVTEPSSKFANIATGEGFYNSPVYLMQHYSNLGKFFNQSEPGSKYTDRYETPLKAQNVQAEDPSAFYNQWYNKLREFAQAREVTGMGSVETRSR